MKKSKISIQKSGSQGERLYKGTPMKVKKGVVVKPKKKLTPAQKSRDDLYMDNLYKKKTNKPSGKIKGALSGE